MGYGGEVIPESPPGITQTEAVKGGSERLRLSPGEEGGGGMNRKASTELLLRSLCLSTIASQYKDLAKNAENDNWDHIHYLHNLCEVEACRTG